MPASMTASSTMIAVRVRRAWTTAGSRKALMPLLIASTPVIAVQPLANERIRSHQRTSGSVGLFSRGGGGATASGCPPASSVLMVPSASTARSDPTNR